MKKEHKIRLILWICLLLVAAAIAFGGRNSYHNFLAYRPLEFDSIARSDRFVTELEKHFSKLGYRPMPGVPEAFRNNVSFPDTPPEQLRSFYNPERSHVFILLRRDDGSLQMYYCYSVTAPGALLRFRVRAAEQPGREISATIPELVVVDSTGEPE